jgi:WD40 repeat protein
MDAGRLVSGSSDRMLSIWLTSDGTCERVLGGHAGTVWGVTCINREGPSHGRRSTTGSSGDLAGSA